MVHFHAVWLVPVAITILGLGLGAKRASSQTTYTFNFNYDSLANTRTITADISATTLSGQSADAPYDLTTINIPFRGSGSVKLSRGAMIASLIFSFVASSLHSLIFPVRRKD